MKLGQWSHRIFFLLALLCAGAAAAQQLVKDRDYRVLSPAQPAENGKKVEVLEFFWYGCPHCNALQPSLSAWLKKKPADVEFRRVPAAFDASWVPLARMYYALEALGAVEKLHHAVFSAIHEQRVRFSDANAMADWVANKGVDRKKFLDAYNSFSVQAHAQRSIDITRNYDLSGTPTLVIDGKYVAAPSTVLKPDNSIDYDRYWKVVDQLIAMARKSRQGK